MIKKCAQRRQEEMYSFPYHYLIRFELEEYRSFSQFISNPSGFIHNPFFPPKGSGKRIVFFN